MTRLPQLPGPECVKALQRAGVVVRRQTGSHIILTQQEPYRLVSVPQHRTLKTGTLRGILSQAGRTVEQFVNLLK